jgi:hypothetical protein
MSVKKVCPRIAIMHKLKERFREILENRKIIERRCGI